MPLVEATEKLERPARRSRWIGTVVLVALILLVLLGAAGAAVFSENGLFLGHMWVMGLARADGTFRGLPPGFSRHSIFENDPRVGGRAFIGPCSMQVLYLNLDRAGVALGWVDLSRCRGVPTADGRAEE